MLDREGKRIRAGDIIFVWGFPETGSPEWVVSKNRVLGIQDEDNFVPLKKFKAGCGRNNLLVKLTPKKEWKDYIGVFGHIFSIKKFKKYLDKKGIKITKETNTVNLWINHMEDFYTDSEKQIKEKIFKDKK